MPSKSFCLDCIHLQHSTVAVYGYCPKRLMFIEAPYIDCKEYKPRNYEGYEQFLFHWYLRLAENANKAVNAFYKHYKEQGIDLNE